MKKALMALALVWCVQPTEDMVQAVMFVSLLPEARMAEAKIITPGVHAADMPTLVFFRADLPPSFKQYVGDDFIIYRMRQGQIIREYTIGRDGEKAKIQKIVKAFYAGK